MKLNIAFQTLLVVVATSAPSCAHARATSYFRDPRTVEKKEPVQRRTMGDFRLPTMLETDVDGKSCEDRLRVEASSMAAGANPTEEERSLACSAVSKDHSECLGCQGFSQVGKEVHIPGCVGMTPDECYTLAQGIVLYKPGWFKDRDGTALVTEELVFVPAGEMTYYKLGLPVSAGDPAPEGSKEVVGVAGNCMVHYSWDWCVPSPNGDTMCLKLQPWDCSASAGECLSSSECCAQIQSEYPKPDINNNELQCYEWVLPVKSSGPSGASAATAATGATVSVSSGLTGNRLVIHVSDNKVALPAVITDGNYKPVHDEEIIASGAGCFPNDLEGHLDMKVPKTLTAAVKAYVDQDCANNDDCAIGQKWGYPMNSWCVEKVTSFRALFDGLWYFNEDINGWTTGQVTDMAWTFYSAFSFNQPLDNWDVSSVGTLNSMFGDAKQFNQNLCHFGDHFDSGKFYQHMFSATNCPNGGLDPTSVNGPWCHDCEPKEKISVTPPECIGRSFPDGYWDLRNAVRAYVDQDCANNDDCAIGQKWGYPINSWCVEQVTNFYGIFHYYEAPTFNEDVNGWTTSQVTYMKHTFLMASSFNQPLDNWDVSLVRDFQGMFNDAKAFNQPLDNWNTTSASDMEYMFNGGTAFNQDLCKWMANVDNMNFDNVQGHQAKVENMFKDTACPNTGDPHLYGSWCSWNC